MQNQALSVRLFTAAALLAAGAACERTPDAHPYELVHTWKLPGEVASLDISRDGQSVLLGSATGESSLWSSPWNLSVPFDRVDEPLLAARFTDDGHLIFLRARGAIEVRSDNGALLLDPHIRLKRPSQFALPSPNGRYVAFDATVYDLEAMRVMVQAEPDEDQRGLAFAGDRMVLVTRAHHPQLTVLRLDGRESVLRHAPDEVMAGAISSDGRYTAAGTTREVLVWEADAAGPMCERQTKAPIEALHFSGSARWLAALSGRRLLVLNAASCEPFTSVPLLDAAAVLDVDADLIAVADASANIYVWDVYNDRMIGRARMFGSKVAQLRLHAQSRSLLVAANGAGRAEVKLLRITGR
jgi:hypothetical protein